MDPLADVLDLARVRGALLASVRASAPWGLALPQGDGASFHAVTSGTAWMCVAEHEPIQLMPGDLVLLPTGARAHDELGRCPWTCPPYVKTPGELAIGGTGAVTTLACAGYSYDLEVAPRLMSLLPTVLHVPADPADGATWRRSSSCSRARSAARRRLARRGRAADRPAADRRRSAPGSPRRRRGWPGCTTRSSRRALALLHERPGEPWTLEALAREVHLSRATLARRFAAAVGEPPLAYLAGWRMDLAARRLRSSTDPIGRSRARSATARSTRSTALRAPSRRAARPLPSRYPACAMADTLKIIVLEGDETGQELLEQSVRVLDAELLGLDLELDYYDLSLEKRRETGNEIVHEAARAMREAGFGLKAATVTPEGKDDVGSPNRILREEVDGKVIVRTGRRIPGVVGPVSGVYHPISVVRMAVDDAYGAKQWREGEGDDEVAFLTQKITRATCRAVAEYSFRTAERIGGAKVYGGPKWTVSPVYEGMLKEEMDAAAERHPVGHLPAGPGRRAVRRPDLRRRRLTTGDPRTESRRRLPVATSCCRCSARSRAPSRCC